MSRTALICGLSGQDGSLLAKFLLDKGYRVVGTSRDAQLATFANLARLGIEDDVEKVSMSLIDFRSVLQVISQVRPDEVYNFAGQSSVGLSFEEPVETMQSHAMGTLNLLEVVRMLDKRIRLYNAGSGECFGDTGGRPADETMPFYPRSPYAVAKATAYWQCVNYREAYQLHVCSGILFNHESPFRPRRFVTRKVVLAACQIARGAKTVLTLGDLGIRRDWGWAPEYVDAMWRMLQTPTAEDYVIATGRSASLEDFVDQAFRCVGLDWREHTVSDKRLFRPSEIRQNCGNAHKALEQLGWQPSSGMAEVVGQMVAAELAEAAAGGQ